MTQQRLQITKTVGIFILAILLVLTSSPIVAIADTSSNTTASSQATSYREGIANTTKTSSGYSSVATDTTTCVGSKILSGYVVKLVSSLIGAITDTAKDETAKITSVTTVAPITNDQLRFQNAATVGHSSGAMIPDTPGWDSIAYCVVNSMITYISDSVITWAKTGFNGEPSFISNTDSFFSNIADQEAGNFLNEISKGTTGINLCSNFSAKIVVSLSNYYSNSGYKKNSSSCSLSKVVSNVKSFESNFNSGGWGGWFSMTQNQNNNAIGATLLATDEMFARISTKNNTAKLDLGLNKGFLNYKKCETSDPDSCKTVTPGIVIQGQLEKTLGLQSDRLVLAQKFDQMVEALVNGLIKVALNEVLTTSTK